MKVFPLQRPENSPWYRAGIACWLLFIGYLWFARDHSKFSSYLFVSMLAVMAIVRDQRLRRTPDRHVEMDEEGIRLFPAGYWVVDSIPWSSVLGHREEGQGIFLHFKNDGIERAVLFERRFFAKGDWDELAGWVKRDTEVFLLAY